MLFRSDITGIFAANDLVAVGVIRAARELGYSIPGDLSIIGYDDIFLSSLPGIELTTIFQEKRRMGELAVKLLLDEINDKKHLKKKKKRIILTPRLIVRNTTGPSK